VRRSWRRSPAETYRLHHNIKGSEYRVIGKPESKLSPQANAAGEQRVSGWRQGVMTGNAAGEQAGRRAVPWRLARRIRAVRVKITE